MVAGETTASRVVGERYRLAEPLGRGGMGTVWLACDELLQRNVAVKHVAVPALDAADRQPVRERVIREARAAARLGHAATVTVFDVVEEDGNVYIVMELVVAETLAEVVSRRGPLPVDEAARIGLELVGALEAAHRQGIVHRDVKPSNVMLPAAGVVKLADFGIASVKDHPSVTGTGQVLGSPSYMAPEQAMSTASGEEVDWWALGATLYFAVEGRPPFERDGVLATLAAVMNEQPATPQRAGPLTGIIERLLDKDPRGRPGPRELRRQLRAVAGTPPPPVPEGAADPPGPAPAPPVAAGEGAALPPTETTPAVEPEPAGGDQVAPVPPVTAVPAPVPESTAKESSAAAPRRAVPPSDRRPPSLVLVALAALVVVLAAAVAWAASNRDGTHPGAPTTSGEEPAADTEEGGVPSGWVTYTDRRVGYRVAHPPDWQVRARGGTRTDIVDPDTGSYLRLDWTDSPGPSPEAAWESLSKSFGARHDQYEEIRIEPTTYKGFDAAEWEYAYTDGGARLHAVDLGFVTTTHGFALNFQTHEERWDDSQDVFDAFKASFAVPR